MLIMVEKSWGLINNAARITLCACVVQWRCWAEYKSLQWVAMTYLRLGGGCQSSCKGGFWLFRIAVPPPWLFNHKWHCNGDKLLYHAQPMNKYSTVSGKNTQTLFLILVLPFHTVFNFISRDVTLHKSHYICLFSPSGWAYLKLPTMPYSFL